MASHHLKPDDVLDITLNLKVIVKDLDCWKGSMTIGDFDAIYKSVKLNGELEEMIKGILIDRLQTIQNVPNYTGHYCIDNIYLEVEENLDD